MYCMQADKEPQADKDPLARFGATIAALDEEVDWPRLGLAYCDEGGLSFFDDEERAAVFDAGLEFAADLGSQLQPGGASLYVGAGVAELAPICFEALILARQVTIASLSGFEVEELNRAFAEVESKVGVSLPRFSGGALGDQTEDGPFDHIWVVSVLTDPDAFPALHDQLYERASLEEGATGRGDLEENRSRADALVSEVLKRLADEATLSTTDEEGSLFGPALVAAGYVIELPETGRLSPIVGDVVRHLYLTKGKAALPMSPWGSGASIPRDPSNPT